MEREATEKLTEWMGKTRSAQELAARFVGLGHHPEYKQRWLKHRLWAVLDATLGRLARVA